MAAADFPTADHPASPPDGQEVVMKEPHGCTGVNESRENSSSLHQEGTFLPKIQHHETAAEATNFVIGASAAEPTSAPQ